MIEVGAHAPSLDGGAGDHRGPHAILARGTESKRLWARTDVSSLQPVRRQSHPTRASSLWHSPGTGSCPIPTLLLADGRITEIYFRLTDRRNKI